MLRRRSLKSTSDLNRRKSTSSTHGVHLEHIDPALAQRDAQIAARHAFTRAQNSTKEEMSLFPPTPESSPRRHQTTRTASSHDDETTSSHDLRRQQSVRFVGPCSVSEKKTTPQGPIVESRCEPEDADLDWANKLREYDTDSVHSYILGNDPQLSVQPPHHPLRAPPPIPLTGMATDYLHAMTAEDEYYHPEDDIASAPSSFRRLRRSRSMFSSDSQGGRGGQVVPLSSSSGKSSIPQPVSALHSRRGFHSEPQQNKVEQVTPALRGPKSMSFLKNRHILRSGSSTDHDTSMRPPTVSEVSDSHEDDSYVVQQRSDSKQSALSGLRGARGEPGMRKSLRSSCSSIEGRESPAISSTALPGKQDGGFKVKARKVSRSVKTKLKSFFTLSKSEDVPSSIPCQHVEAKKSHVSEGFGTFRSFESQVDDACGPIHNVQTKVPSLQIVPSDLIRSNKGSVESLRSERDRDRERERKVSDDKTSFTSWTNSGPSTLTSQQQQQWSEWEAQRLSTIKENGPHAPSSSLRRMPLQTNLFEPPDDEDQNTPPAMSNVKIDSQRVYSALMKRMKVLNAQVAQTMEQPQITVETTEVVERMVTAKSEDMTPGTARRPGAGQQRFALSDTADTPTRPSKGPRAADEQSSEIKVVGNTGHGYMARAKREAKDICAAFKIGGSRAGSMGTANPIHAMPEPSGKDGLPLFAPSTEPAHVAAEKTAQDSKSPLFGSSGSHTFRTESPYRRALRRSMEEEQKVWSQQHLASQLQALKDDADAHDDTGESGSDSGKDLDYSESVYSTDEIEAAGRGTDVARGQGSRGWKAANRQSTETPATYQPKGYHRETSSASSVDWKTWLSANIAKLDSSPPLPKPPSEVEYALPTMPNNFSGGHVREAAQIYGDEDDYLELPTRKPTLPTTPLTPVEPNVVKIQPAQRSVKRNSPPSGGRTLPENDIPGGPPPIPIKSALRPSPLKISRPNTGRSITTPSITSSPGLTAAVQRQFGPVSRQVDGDYKNCGVQLRQRPSGRLRTVESVDGGFGGFGSDSDTGAFI